MWSTGLCDDNGSTANLQVRWSGFEHPHDNINFTVCISNNTNNDLMTCAKISSGNQHTFSGLNLTIYKVVLQNYFLMTSILSIGHGYSIKKVHRNYYYIIVPSINQSIQGFGKYFNFGGSAVYFLLLI